MDVARSFARHNGADLLDCRVADSAHDDAGIAAFDCRQTWRFGGQPVGLAIPVPSGLLTGARPVEPPGPGGDTVRAFNTFPRLGDATPPISTSILALVAAAETSAALTKCKGDSSSQDRCRRFRRLDDFSRQLPHRSDL
jgi:hypothetical protein